MALPNSAVPNSAAPTAPGWAVPPGPWTEQHLSVAADGHRYEVVDGCLHVTPPPPEPHGTIVQHLLAALAGAAPPGWRPVAGPGLRLGDSHLAPDAVVLRPGSPPEPDWVDPVDVALVVEVESPHSRRVDRCLKAGMYAEAGIESYWRIEAHGPVAHTYTRASGGHYLLHRRVHPGQCVTAELPFAVQLAPATWH